MFLSVSIVLISILLIWDHIHRKKKNDIAFNIPGPPVYPIIGNLFNFQQRSVDDFAEFMKTFILRYGGLVRTWLFQKMMVIVAEPRALEVLLSSPKYIKKNTIYNFFSVWLGDGLLLSNGKKWFQRRKIITPTFHFKILEDFVEIFNEQSNVFVDRIKHESGNGAFDISPYVTLATLDIITETALGTKLNVQNNPDSEYARAVYTFSEIAMLRIIKPHLQIDFVMKHFAPKLQKRQDEAVASLHGFTERIIVERRNLLVAQKEFEIGDSFEVNDFGNKRKLAFLDNLLLSTIDGKPLTDEDIHDEVNTFTFEGHDTTAAGIAFAFYCISRHPDVQNKLFEEIRAVIGDDISKLSTMKDLNDLKYMEQVLKETMRMFPPVPFVGRQLEEDLQIDDKIIPSGADLMLPLFLVFKDPKLFPDPEIFNPERFSKENNAENANTYAYIPFSAGPRNCIGQKFAMLEMKSLVSKVLRNFELLPLGEKPELKINVLLKSSNGVQLGIRPRFYA